jgi:hypothetical protein
MSQTDAYNKGIQKINVDNMPVSKREVKSIAANTHLLESGF